jgi:hypothetical protein
MLAVTPDKPRRLEANYCGAGYSGVKLSST